MMKVWIIIAICIAVKATECWSCEYRGVECIDYEVVVKYEEYEDRQYPSLLWVSTKESGPSLSKAQSNMYKKLFRYIQGDNLKGEFVNSTTPTRTKVVPCKDDSFCEPTYTMSMLVPKALRPDLYPIPTDVDLFFEKEPAKRYLVRSFDGYPKESQWFAEAQKLADLTSKEEGVCRGYYYLNFYDPPLQAFDRLNEVWITKNPSVKNSGVERNEVC